MKISTLIDLGDNEVIFISTTVHDIKNLIKNYLIQNKWFNDEIFYNNGSTALTGKEFINHLEYFDEFKKQTFEIDINGKVKEILD